MLESRKVKNNSKEVEDKTRIMVFNFTEKSKTRPSHRVLEIFKAHQLSVIRVPHFRSHRVSNQRNILVQGIVNELVNDFGIDKTLAIRFISQAKVIPSLITNPIGFHDSPHQWAVKVLTKVNDHKTLSKYYGL